MLFKNDITSKLKRVVTVSALQVLMVTVVMGQYLDQVNVTNNKEEYTYNYKEVNGSLYSVSSIYGDSVNQLGYNYIEFKKYDANFQPILTTFYFDTINFYIAYYGFEYINDALYFSGTKYNGTTQDTLIGFIIKVDTLGNFIWEKNYYTTEEQTKCIYLTSLDSSLYCATSIYNPNSTGVLYTKILGIDTSGTLTWDTAISGYDQQPSSIRKTSDNGLIVSTFANYQAGAMNPIVYKLDSLHNVKWSKVLGPNTKNHALQFFELPSGNYLGLGSSEEPGTGYGRSWLVELGKSNGQVLKDTVYWFAPNSSTFDGNSNVLFNNNEIIAIASKSANSMNVGQPYHQLLINMSYNYELNWEREYYRRNTDNALYGIYKKNNFYYLQGLVLQDNSTNTNDEWFLVVDSLGCTVQGCSVGITEQEGMRERVMDVYPNPSNGSFTIVLSESIRTGEIVITDLTGKQIKKMRVQPQVNISLSQLSEGIYIVHLQTGSHIIETQKIVIQK